MWGGQAGKQKSLELEPAPGNSFHIIFLPLSLIKNPAERADLKQLMVSPLILDSPVSYPSSTS